MKYAVVYVVAILIASDVFPENMQALAGAIINTVGQFGTSFGIAIMAIISTRVNDSSSHSSETNGLALLPGYRVVFWVSFALTIIVAVIGAIGLRKVGKIGGKEKQEKN